MPQIEWSPAGTVSIVELAVSLGIATAGIFLAFGVNRLMKWLAEKAKESTFRFDGILVKVASTPTAILVGALSFFYALRRIKAIDQYLQQWKRLDVAIIIVIVTWMVGSLVREIIDSYLQPYVEESESDFDERLLYLLDLTAAYIIYVLGFAIALHTLGIEISALIASLGIAGLAVALATKTILSNFFGGIILTMDKYIQPGDRVQVGDWVGDVEEITLYKTTVRTLDNLLVSIPNDSLMHETTINYNLPEALTRVEVSVGVGYDTDLDHATEIIHNILEGVEGVTTRKDPEVNVESLGDSAINLQILAWQDHPTAQRRTKDRIYRRIIKRFREEQIEIPFPQRDVTVTEKGSVE
ncbi:MAG: mechanosensitive ion channel family protein [bacterium]